MLFNILTENHGSADNIAPLIDYVRYTLARCGHEVILERSRLRQEAVNLYFEHFVNREAVDNFVAFKAEHDLVVGVIATELMVDSHFPGLPVELQYGGRPDAAAILEARVDNFERLLPSLDFLWCFLERTANEYRGRCRFVDLFRVGHAFNVPDDLRRAPRDIDILFFGSSTPHRTRILERLTKEGLTVTAFGPGFARGVAASVELNSMLDRAKLGLSVAFQEYTDRNLIDPRFPSCHRVPEMIEHGVCVVSEMIPLDNYYADYMVSADVSEVAAVCRDLLVTGEWRQRAKIATEKFRQEMDVERICKPVIEKTLATIRRP